MLEYNSTDGEHVSVVYKKFWVKKFHENLWSLWNFIFNLRQLGEAGNEVDPVFLERVSGALEFCCHSTGHTFFH